MTGLTVTVADPRTDPEPPGWAEFFGRQELHTPWRYDLMRLESLAGADPTLLVLARRGPDLVAALSVVRCRTRLGLTWMEVHQPWMAGLPGWVFGPGLAEAGARREALRAMERAVCRRGGPGCLGLVYKHVPSEDLPLVDGRGRRHRATVANSVLVNHFSGYQDWLGSLAKKPRQTLSQLQRRLAARPDLTVRFGPGRTDLDPDTMAAMLSAHRASFGRLRYDRRVPMSAAYLGALTAQPRTYTLTYHGEADQLLAFGVLVDHPVTPFYLVWASVGEAGGRRGGLYFDGLRRGVEFMLEHRRSALIAGRGLNEVKTRYGFTDQPRVVVAVPRLVAG